MSVSTRQHALVIVRSTLLGTSVGLLIGLYEAAYLYCTPRPPLLQPDVSYVIWFVAPLVDAILGFVGGLVVGWLKGNRHPIAKGVAATLGATGALVASGVGALALRSVTKGQSVPASWLWMTVALGGVFLAAYLIRQRVQRFFQIKGLSPIKTFATAEDGSFNVTAQIMWVELGLGDRHIAGCEFCTILSLKQRAQLQRLAEESLVCCS